jgi:hypothetical protein
MTKTCPQCHEDFEPNDYRQTFCTRTCSARFNNLARGFMLRSERADCVICGTKLKKHQKNTCSVSCRGKHARAARVERWLAGDATLASYEDGSLSSWAKNWLLEEAKWVCTRCGWGEPNPTLGRPILSIDHVDGDWTNNARTNLVVLCYNCHTLTPTFGSLNRGSKSGRRPNAANRKIKVG